MSLVRQLQNYRLTTAEILYHLPDHPALLQTFIWQDLDIAPQYPVLHKFLEFWKREIEGNLHSVRVASSKLINPGRCGTRRHCCICINRSGAWRIGLRTWWAIPRQRAQRDT